MLGFGDWQVAAGYILTLASVVLCIAYGVVNWNKPKEDQLNEIKEETEWEKRDPDLNEGGAE